MSASGAVSFAAGVTSPTFGGLSGAAGSVNLATAASQPVTLNVGQNGQNTTYAGVLSGAGGLTKVGAGTLQLSAANTYGGPTVIASGTLQLSGGMPPVTAGLVGYWPLNEGTGTTAYDRSGIATPANGTLSGNASWVPVANAGTAGYPPFATAVQINGNSPGVTMGALSAFGNSTTSQFGSVRTISGWVELVAPTLAQGYLGDWHDMFGFIGQEGNGGTFFDMESGNGQNFVTHTYGGDTTISPIVTSQWVYLTATFDPNSDNGNVNVYYNGALAASVQQHGGVLQTFDNFGIELSRPGWTEDVSDVTVYNASLTSAQVAQLYSWHGTGSGVLPVTTALSIAPNSALDLNGGAQTVASLSDSSPRHGGNVINSNAGSSSVLTLTPSTGVSTTFSGTIGDNGSNNSPGSIALVLDGPGTMVLSGTNSYTGGTTVWNGTLQLNNSAAIEDGTSLSVGSGLAAFGLVEPSAVVAPAATTGAAAAAPATGVGAVPEPGTLALLGVAGIVAAAAAYRRRRIKS